MKHLLPFILCALAFAADDRESMLRACFRGDTAEVTRLLKAGVSPDTRDGQKSALGEAIAGRQPAIVKLLRDSGAHTDAVLFEDALRSGDREILHAIIDRMLPANAPARGGGMPTIQEAALRGHANVVLMLIQHHTPPDQQDHDGDTAMHKAALKSYHSIVNLLLNAGADPNVKNAQGITPLHDAVLSGHAETVQLLIDRGARLDLADAEGATPLYYAAAFDHADVVELLLRSGAPLNVHTKDGATPETVAKREGYRDVLNVIETYRKSAR